MIIVNTPEIPNLKISEVHGIARGSTVRARNVGSDIFAGLKNLVGGEISEYTKLTKLSRETLEPVIKSLIDKHKTNFKGVGQPLRIALVGSRFGPALYDLILSLNKGEVLKRLNTNEAGHIQLEIPLLENQNKNKNDLIFFTLLFTYVFIFYFTKKKND